MSNHKPVDPEAVKTRVQRECYMVCPVCGNFSASAELLNFCLACGTKLINACPQCHEPILYPTGKYCPVCGVQLVAAAKPDAGK